MDERKHTPRFWLGNALLGLALVALFLMGTLWQYLGYWAMGLWMALAGLGMYLVTSEKGHSGLPD